MNMPRIISRLFEPLVVFIILIGVAIVESSIKPVDAVRLFLFFIFAILMPPVLLLIIALKKGWVSSWDISDRRQRVRAFTIMLLILFVDMYGISLMAPSPITYLFFVLFFWFIGFFLFTLRWKLSGHVGFLTLAIIFLIYWFGYGWWPLLFTIPLLSWARVRGNYHTVGEVIGGAVYSIVYSVMFYYYS